MEALRRRVGELDLGNALVREVADAFAASKGRYGCRGIKAALRTGVSEKVTERIMAEDGLVAHVPGRRRYGSYEGETTPAPGNLIARDFTAERPNEKRLTDIAEVKAADGKVYLSPVIGCHDGKIVAPTQPDAAPTRGSPTPCWRSRPPRCPRARVLWCVPTAAVTMGVRDGRNSW